MMRIPIGAASLVVLLSIVVTNSVGDKMKLLWKAPKSAEYYEELAKLAVRTKAHSQAVKQQEYERAKKFYPHLSDRGDKYLSRDGKNAQEQNDQQTNNFKVYYPKGHVSTDQFYKNWNREVRDQPWIYSRPEIVEGVVVEPSEKTSVNGKNVNKEKDTRRHHHQSNHRRHHHHQERQRTAINQAEKKHPISASKHAERNDHDDKGAKGHRFNGRYKNNNHHNNNDDKSHSYPEMAIIQDGDEVSLERWSYENQRHALPETTKRPGRAIPGKHSLDHDQAEEKPTTKAQPASASTPFWWMRTSSTIASSPSTTTTTAIATRGTSPTTRPNLPSRTPSTTAPESSITTPSADIPAIPVVNVMPFDSSMFNELDAESRDNSHHTESTTHYRRHTKQHRNQSHDDDHDKDKSSRRTVTFIDNSETTPIAPSSTPKPPVHHAATSRKTSRTEKAPPFRRTHRPRFTIRAHSGRKITVVTSNGTRDANFVEHEGVYCEPRSTRTYNRSRWVCCNNTLKPRIKNAWMTSCCGAQTYNPKRSICCEGHLQIKHNRKQMCCGQKTYNPENFVCCDGQINFARKNGRFKRRTNACCGKWTYNPKEQICCSGQINQRTRGLRSCCKTTPYNPYSHSCCNDGIRPKYQGCVSWGRRLIR